MNMSGISDEVLDGDIVLTDAQLDDILRQMETPGGKGRTKRKVVDFENSRNKKWILPIHYKFDGAHSEYIVLKVKKRKQMKIR